VLKHGVRIVTSGPQRVRFVHYFYILLPIIRGNGGAKDVRITHFSNFISRLAIAVGRNYLIQMKTEMAQIFVKSSSVVFYENQTNS
jgi:hypothetical protein